MRFILVGIFTFYAAVANATPLVTFEWRVDGVRSPLPVAPGAERASVELWALQDGGADAAFITLGFEPLGFVTDVELQGFGPGISLADSFFGSFFGDDISMIASSPNPPGSFGSDEDLIVATLDLILDGDALPGSGGAVRLLDLTAIAGAPALDSLAIEIDSNIRGIQVLNVVPEPMSFLLAAPLLAGLLAARSRRRPR